MKMIRNANIKTGSKDWTQSWVGSKCWSRTVLCSTSTSWSGSWARSRIWLWTWSLFRFEELL